MIRELGEKYRHFFEKSAFGVCQAIGEKMGIKPSRIRIYFIYTSFLTFGSPFILYFIAVFWLNLKKYISSGKKILWG